MEQVKETFDNDGSCLRELEVGGGPRHDTLGRGTDSRRVLERVHERLLGFLLGHCNFYGLVPRESLSCFPVCNRFVQGCGNPGAGADRYMRSTHQPWDSPWNSPCGAIKNSVKCEELMSGGASKQVPATTENAQRGWLHDEVGHHVWVPRDVVTKFRCCEVGFPEVPRHCLLKNGGVECMPAPGGLSLPPALPAVGCWVMILHPEAGQTRSKTGQSVDIVPVDHPIAENRNLGGDSLPRSARHEERSF